MNYELLFSMLERQEGLRLKAYKCSKGYLTVGIGRNLDSVGLNDSECFEIFGDSISDARIIAAFKTGYLITEDQARMLFANDVSEAEEGCYKIIDMGALNDARKAVFISMAFQMGVAGLSDFTNTIAAANNADFELCADEMLDSKWFRNDTPGRAQEMSDQMRSGEWQ
jgi:lysozyme